MHYLNLIAGLKNEIANRKGAKIAHIAVCFSTMINNVYTGLLVDSMLQCDKNEMGLLVPASWKDHLLPLLLSLSWSIREYNFGDCQPWSYYGGAAEPREVIADNIGDGNMSLF